MIYSSARKLKLEGDEHDKKEVKSYDSWHECSKQPRKGFWVYVPIQPGNRERTVKRGTASEQ